MTLARMNTIKGPAIFLAQFLGDGPLFEDIYTASAWMAKQGYKGVQLPTENPAQFDLELAASSDTYCDEVKGRLAEAGVEISELAAHIQGQLVAVHPAYDALFDGFAPEAVRNNPKARTEWAISQMTYVAQASRRFGLDHVAAFPGALLWPYVYPWPHRPQGLVDEGFAELGTRWRPILDEFDRQGVNCCFEIHPGEDLHDGASFERFLEEVDGHQRANILYDPSHLHLQCLDYLGFIDAYHERIKMFHVKDAEFTPSASTGVYGGYQPWRARAGRFRSLGDGQINFGSIFSKLTHYGYDGWAVVEWECCIKDPLEGAKEGAPFVANHIITPTPVAFDDFARTRAEVKAFRQMMGLGEDH